MTEERAGSIGLTRRALMTAGAAAGAALAGWPAAAPAAGQMPMRLPTLPVGWGRAPTIPLWPTVVPGTGFRATPVPADAPSIFVQNVATPRLHVFVSANPDGRAILCMPGGAYKFISIYNEGWQIVERLNARGITVFVLIYRLPGEGWADRADVPLQDAQRAMRVIRSQAMRWRVDPARIDALGFSAGGHLAASLATGWGTPLAPARDAVDALSAAPRRCGLIYPVISHQPGVGHAESTQLLLGDAPDSATVARRSPAQHVDAATPPLFLVHALDDMAVPVENSLLMLAAARKAGRPVEAHLFERGGHGFGPGAPGFPAVRWPDLFADWLDQPAAPEMPR